MKDTYTIPSKSIKCKVIDYKESLLEDCPEDFMMTKIKSKTDTLNNEDEFRIVVPDCVEVIGGDNCGLYFKVKDKDNEHSICGTKIK